MASWFAQTGPYRVASDTVAPMRYWDDTVVLKSLVVYSLSRYDVALDAQKLYNGLERLASLKGWRKLGARLRRNDNGQIEYHVPAEFTPERPAVSFSHAKHAMSIADHPLASRLPRANGEKPVIAGDPEQFTSLTRPEGTPNSIDDYLTQDRGQIALHIVSFTDAALVVMYYNHTSFDLMGWGAIMTAWSHILHGREDFVAMPVGGDPGSAEFDFGVDLGTKTTAPHVLAHRQMNMFGLVGYGIRNALDLAWKAKENRIVCVPAAFVERLKVEALQELCNVPGTSGSPFLSDGDVLAAWWARLAASTAVSHQSNRTVSIQYAASARKALGLSTDLGTNPYISNLFTILYTLLPAHDLINKPLSQTTDKIRKSIVEQGTREQVEAYLALQRDSAGKMLPLMGDSGMHMMTISNWCKANLYGHDFGPAATSPQDQVKVQ